ncbi:hypothetical protein GCM10007907_18270 [Chitinimonas prasina]|uniref:Uncharacterized protein n=1 Tax=Chitinimonas prasina TaxID=1434937 RepID=A0ABQ5YDJ8_9NEIS|nr:hypothetical protein GCM10007907_18270 [Chitinimonas prasina]
MNISGLDLEVLDITWFAVDATGSIAAFASAGSGVVPLSIMQSFGEMEFLFKYFSSAAEASDWYSVDSNISSVTGNVECYVSAFSWLSRKGVFAYDAKGLSYFPVTVPVSPCKLHDLPSEVAQVLAKTTFSGVFFSDQLEILPES